MNRPLLLVAFICLLFMKAKADIIIIDGKTFNLNSESPLNQYPFVKSIKERLISYRTTAYDDPCDSYNAEWSIIKNELYLTNIYSCNDTKLQYKTNLKSVFEDNSSISIENGKVKASWFTGDIWLPQGQQIGHYDMMISFYQTEKRISISKGELMDIKDFNYPHAQELIYINQNTNDAMSKFIYSHINWSKLPPLNGQVKKIPISFETGISGSPENIKLIRESAENMAFKEEAKRVIGLIPLGAYYKHGQIFKQYWTMPFTFSEELRQKYSK